MKRFTEEEQKEKARLRTRKWKSDHPEKHYSLLPEEEKVKQRKRCRGWAKKNPDRKSKYNKEYAAKPENKQRRRTKRLKANGGMNRYYSDIQTRLTILLRGRLHRLVSKNNFRKSAPTLELLGCTLEFFKQYLESKFTDGMSWDNYGVHGWHIDHSVACRRFTLARESHQRACFHFTNLAPLWGKENCGKDSRPVPKLTDAEVATMLQRQLWDEKFIPIPQTEQKPQPNILGAIGT